MPHSIPPLNTPVLFIIFNRPDTTQQVFQRIREVRPRRLFIAADAPRPNKEGEKERCEATRKVVETIDWHCDVQRLYRDENAGCGMGVSGAISWMFSQVEQGIILEDDCVPDRSFFRYCEELLERYKTDTRIMQIVGTNALLGENVNADSYYFSANPSVWGWATWRRAWEKFDYNMTDFEEFKARNEIENAYPNARLAEIQMRKFENRKNIVVTWDYQWQFAMAINSGMAVVPEVNLIKNIGFSTEATHTTSMPELYHKVQVESLDFPLRHPKFVVVNHRADRKVFDIWKPLPPEPSLARKIGRRILPEKIKNILRKIVK